MFGKKDIKRGDSDRSSLLLPIAFLFLITRKEYKIPSMSFFIPNKNLIYSGKSEQQSKIEIARKILNNVTFSFTNTPEIGFLFGIKPIYGIEVPVKVWMPLDIPLAVPQILYKLKQGILIKPIRKFGILLGYNVYIPEITFYA